MVLASLLMYPNTEGLSLQKPEIYHKKRVIQSPFVLLLRGPLRPLARDEERLYHEATFPALITFGLLGSGVNTAMQAT